MPKSTLGLPCQEELLWCQQCEKRLFPLLHDTQSRVVWESCRCQHIQTLPTERRVVRILWDLCRKNRTCCQECYIFNPTPPKKELEKVLEGLLWYQSIYLYSFKTFPKIFVGFLFLLDITTWHWRTNTCRNVSKYFRFAHKFDNQWVLHWCRW